VSTIVIEFSDLLRDLRHERARAATDLADWLAYLKVEGKADRTLYEYTRKTAPLLRDHPEKTVGEFTAADVNEALAGIPERSRYISRSIYNAFFQWADDDERLTVNPMRRVPKMRQPKRRPKDIFSEEEVALLEALPSPHGQLFTILFGTGLRRGEAISLRRDHVDLHRARLIVYSGKGDKDRIIPISATVQAAIADLDLLERLGRDEYVWALVRKGRYRFRKAEIGGTTFETWYRNRIRDAGVRYLNPHQTRHTYGHRLRELGFDLEERKLLMGHEAITTTVRYYGHLTIEDVARKVALL
jgi:integrase/recombinase XerD